MTTALLTATMTAPMAVGAGKRSDILLAVIAPGQALATGWAVWTLPQALGPDARGALCWPWRPFPRPYLVR